MNIKTETPSKQTIQTAESIAKSMQKPGQTKEQSKLIAQGIQKGIAQYKKQQKIKAREADKAKKKQQKSKQNAELLLDDNPPKTNQHKLPWVLLTISWLMFIVYFLATN